MEGKHRPRAYCAFGAVNRAESTFDLEVKAVLEELGYDTRFSQDYAGSLEDHVEQGMTLAQARQHIFEQKLQAVEGTDVLLFLLDGRAPDIGACVEAGLAFGRGKRCIGLKADSYEAGSGANDLMLDGVLDYEIATDLRGLTSLLSKERAVVDLGAGNGKITVDLRSIEDPYVAISGPLGVGKTSLIELMNRVGNWTVLPEPITENPYLSEVYSNLTDLSFRMQTFYMGQRALQHQSAREISGPLVQERCLSEDGEVFNRAFRDHGAYDDNDLATLMTMHRGLMEQTRRPDLLVYLVAPFGVTVDRIRKRDRIAERDVDIDLLRVIYDRYEDWSWEQSQVPVLRIETSDLDYVNRPEAAAEVMRRINSVLTGAAVSV